MSDKPTISNSIFQVNQLNLWYDSGRKHALVDVSIDLPPRKVTALIGPSGCGKSTFIRCLNKMNDLIVGVKLAGSIKFDGKYELVANHPLELRTRVGMVFQKPNPFPMSIYDNVAYGPRSSGIKSPRELNDIVEKALRDAALWEEVKDNLFDDALGLSGGQQQRLCIARAIAMEPEVLLMDEPTSALDPIATNKIERLMNQLKKKYTIIVVTHSMQQAARISDFTAFFYLGKLVEFDKTRLIFTKPKQRLTKDYIRGKMG
ncbi:uncharacterized protein LOC111613610 [Centruroides sculpturatus]|uniref:uncharacterized protein LOC111613610 n=1 Tax=Centruroides sculpturatus TaxID=218467 RepID=UPI000C6EA7A8|nr:uncharacterized protein LOC111613610 [Centruroides sculpturatus]